MSIVTSSHGLAKSALSKELLFSFISIFKMNANGDPYTLQTADSEFKSKLTILESISKSFPKINCLKSFFQNLETDEKFLLFNFLIEDDVESTFKYKIAIDNINKKPSIISHTDDYSVVNDYVIYCFGDEKRYVGRKKKEERICRFCGLSYPEVTFDKKAHAISESLGNKKIFCNDECDSCNKNFGKLEQQFYNSIAFLFSLYQRKGKEGLRNIKSKFLQIDNNSSPQPKISFKNIRVDLPENIHDINGFHFEVETPEYKFIPQNIYKCLCKYALSLIASKYLSKLTSTIKWVTSENFEKKLPYIWVRDLSEMYDEPLIGIYIRNHLSAELPLFFVRLFVLNIEYLFILPLFEEDDSNSARNFISLNEVMSVKLKVWFPGIKFFEKDYSSTEYQSLPITVTVEVPEGSQKNEFLEPTLNNTWVCDEL